jgi:hypothetical protein
MKCFGAIRFAIAAALLPVVAVQQGFAWGAQGHKMISRIAVANLPVDAPAFLHNGAALDIMEYMAPAPDRWRSRAEPDLNATSTPDHFIDWEWAHYGEVPCTAGPDCKGGVELPRLRYDFVRAVAKYQAAHPETKLTAETVGMQPWQVEEVYERLRVEFREYRKLVAANQDTAPVQAMILFEAAWLGHYVGDGSQPLHATMQYNGWTGPNPNGYTVEHKIHAQFETIYVNANITTADIAPLVAASKPIVIDDEWAAYLAFLKRSNSLVEPLYKLDKTGAFNGAGTPQGKAFVEERMAAGAIELRDLIYTAWIKSADPVEEYKGPV